MSSLAEHPRCPVCELPAGDDQYARLDAKVCHMWHVANGGRCTPSWDAMMWCMRRGKDRRLQVEQLRATVLDLSRQLAVAKAALSRHHAAINAKAEPFRDNARIE